MTAAEILLKYVEAHGWYSVANIYHDNEYSHQPHGANGLICASPSMEVLFTAGKVDFENSDIIDHKYVVTPYKHIDFEQSVTVLPFEHIQRFDALTFTQAHHFELQGPVGDFPIPTLPSPDEIMAIVVDPETGKAEGHPTAVLTNRRYTDKVRNGEDEKYATEIAVFDVHPDHPEWSNDKFMGLRIKNIQTFIENQRLFCQRCNAMFGVSDCV